MRVLVVHTWGLGDLLMATPMLKSLAQSGHEVELALTNAANAKLLQENGFLQKIHIIKGKLDFLRFVGRYDALVTTAGMDPKKAKNLARLLLIRRWYGGHQPRGIHRIEANLRIVDPLLSRRDTEPYIYIPPLSPGLERAYLQSGPNIGLAPGSGAKQKYKRWPYFRDLAKWLEGNILLFVGPDELELADEFADLGVRVVQEPLLDVVALISRLDLLVGNDNGLMHIGYATKRNCVTIHGMTNEKETGGYRPNNEAICLPLECRPCFDPASNKLGCDTLECLRLLEPQRVYEACEKFLP